MFGMSFDSTARQKADTSEAGVEKSSKDWLLDRAKVVRLLCVAISLGSRWRGGSLVYEVREEITQGINVD